MSPNSSVANVSKQFGGKMSPNSSVAKCLQTARWQNVFKQFGGIMSPNSSVVTEWLYSADDADPLIKLTKKAFPIKT